MPRISLVIPARNEERLLPRLLDSVDAARERYRHGPAAIEVIVADNVSTDATAQIARSRGCRVVTVEKRVIGAVRNGGAREARGETLVFVDADARLHPETFNVIEDALATGKVVGGATGVKLERMSPGIAVTFALLMPVVWIMRMDTGANFCSKADFEAIGGYREHLLFAEDVRILMDLRRLGKARGQRLSRTTKAKAIASARKFDKYGDWHYVAGLAKGAYYALRPKALASFVRGYWYDDRG